VIEALDSKIKCIRLYKLVKKVIGPILKNGLEKSIEPGKIL
jgi:hypothetical protein